MHVRLVRLPVTRSKRFYNNRLQIFIRLPSLGGFFKGEVVFLFGFIFAKCLRLFRVKNYASSSYPVFLRPGPILRPCRGPYTCLLLAYDLSFPSPQPKPCINPLHRDRSQSWNPTFMLCVSTSLLCA